MQKTFALLTFLLSLYSAVYSQNARLIDSLKLETRIAQNRAIAAKKDADRRRYLAIAQTIAEISIEVHDPELSKLLSIQAHRFNSKYDGYIYDPKIHFALTKALEREGLLPQKIEDVFKSNQRILSPPAAPFLFCIGKDKVLTKLSQQESGWRTENILQLNSSCLPETAVVNDSGDLLAHGTNAGVIEVYDLTRPNLKPKIVSIGKQSIQQIVFIPEGKGFYVLANGGLRILRYDLKKIEEVINLKDPVTKLDITVNGSPLVGMDTFGIFHIWDESFRENTFTLNKYATPTDFICANERNIIISNKAGEILIHSKEKMRRILYGSRSVMTHIILSHNKKFMATATQDNFILIWNLKELKERPIKIQHSSSIHSLAFSPDDQSLVVSGISQTGQNSIDIWPLSQAQMAELLCTTVKRNLTLEEWEIYVADDLPYEFTCH
ncbi:MAG: WD40 repeat domain-containing protein [Cyclobacteriaceae bacterium]|jgi:WD40 repeat protein|nr:WD40 repeat domain-containing protein [Flammeovirgaceae bacterium]